MLPIVPGIFCANDIVTQEVCLFPDQKVCRFFTKKVSRPGLAKELTRRQRIQQRAQTSPGGPAGFGERFNRSVPARHPGEKVELDCGNQNARPRIGPQILEDAQGKLSLMVMSTIHGVPGPDIQTIFRGGRVAPGDSIQGGKDQDSARGKRQPYRPRPIHRS